MPWQLAKDPGQRARLGTVLYYLLEVARESALLLSPAMPLVPGKVWAQIGADPEKNKSWDDLEWGGVQPGAIVRKGANLFPRIELSSLQGESEGPPSNGESEGSTSGSLSGPPSNGESGRPPSKGEKPDVL
jgi:methionyl-tRNA synthetase